MRACACVRQACISACPEACVVVCLEMCRCVLACLEAREYICARACPCPRAAAARMLGLVAPVRVLACMGRACGPACVRASEPACGPSVLVSVRVRACERACWCLWASLHLLSLSLSLRDRSGQHGMYVYYYRTYEKAVSGGGREGKRRTCAKGHYQPRPVRSSLATSH